MARLRPARGYPSSKEGPAEFYGSHDGPVMGQQLLSKDLGELAELVERGLVRRRGAAEATPTDTAQNKKAAVKLGSGQRPVGRATRGGSVGAALGSTRSRSYGKGDATPPLRTSVARAALCIRCASTTCQIPLS